MVNGHVMYCANCGEKLEDDARFCTACGTPVESGIEECSEEDSILESVVSGQDAQAVASSVQETAAIHRMQETKEMPVVSEQAAAVQQPAASGSQKKYGVVIAIICIAVVALIALGIFVFFQVKAHEESHAPVSVQFSFSYSGDQSAQPIGIPFDIQGTDLDGNAVDEQFLATPDGAVTELLAGSYTVTVAGNPVSVTGVVYEVGENAEQALEIPVPNGESDEQTQSVTPDLGFSFQVVAPDKVSDQQVGAIESWMTNFGVASDEIQSISAAIVERRNAEIARAALEQEKQAALAANPRVVVGPNPVTHAPGETVRLTGTVRVGFFDSGFGDSGRGNVCYLELPSEITVTGTQYDEQHSNKIILGDDFASYQDKVVTISASLSVRVTQSIKESACSRIWAVAPQLVRVF